MRTRRCAAFELAVARTGESAYVLNGSRPAAESGTSVSGHGTNGAGIDLGEKVWSLLGRTGNTEVEWEFV